MLTPEQKEARKLYSKQWREANKEKLAEYHRNYRKNNPDVNKHNTKRYRESNPDKVKATSKKYKSNNRAKIKSYQITYKNRRNELEQFKRDNDPVYKLRNSIRNAINKACKKNNFKKSSRTAEILGCSYEEFKLYIESLWEPWMNWDNYGLYNGIEGYGWDIDHIIPISSAVTEEDVLRLNHYTNLRPLCSKVNRDIKRNKTA